MIFGHSRCIESILMTVTLLLFFKKIFIGIKLIYNVVLVLGVQHRESVLHIYIIFRFFSHIGYDRILSRELCTLK